MKVVILAGGAGRRLENLLAGRPKSLINVLGKPLIYYTLISLSKLGLWDIVLVTDKPSYFEEVPAGIPPTLDVKIVKQEKPEVEGALLSAEDYVKNEERFLMLYGSVITDYEAYRSVIDASKYFKFNALAVPEADLTGLETLEIDINNFITKFSSEPKGYAFGGMAVMPPKVMELLKSGYSLTRSLTEISKEFKVRAVIFDGWWIDIKVPWDVLRASYYLLSNLTESRISNKARISPHTIIEGPVIIEDGAEIDHGVVIKGPAYIGRNVFVGLNSIVRNYSDLEKDVMIGSLNEITWSLIMDRAFVSRNCFISFSVVGYDAVLEPNVITLSVIRERGKVERPLKVSSRGREYVKLGAIISSKRRVKAGTILTPAQVI